MFAAISPAPAPGAPVPELRLWGESLICYLANERMNFTNSLI